MPRGHRISLKIKSRPGSGENKFAGPEVELLIDGKKAEFVEQITIGLHAEHMVPVVFLKLIPGELDLELDSPAVLHANMVELAKGMTFGLDGKFRVNKDDQTGVEVECGSPLPSLTPEETGRLADQWRREFNGTPAPQGSNTERESDRVFRDTLLGGEPKTSQFADPPHAETTIREGFAILDEMVRNGEHSQPVVLCVKDGKIVKGTLEEYEKKGKNPLPPVG